MGVWAVAELEKKTSAHPRKAICTRVVRSNEGVMAGGATFVMDLVFIEGGYHFEVPD
jgi:hypothetical protein